MYFVSIEKVYTINCIHRDRMIGVYIFGHALSRCFIQIESSTLSVNPEKQFIFFTKDLYILHYFSTGYA